ncbi:uncharacterized protein LOC143258608 isoform X1 [Tachypleus tridentatus]|uniref:uncharacterized protein LOC143258608 isoform X1 n=2 Tax=Tachypleus tridentatus TaxID=6853 RepID=UPI003FD0AAEF
MGNDCCKSHRSSRVITLMMIGLDNAGKTCTVKHFLGESTDDVVPTVGFSNIERIYGKFRLVIYDIGGGSKIRAIWKNYYALVYGIVFVMDATEASRIPEIKHVITEVLQDPRIAGKPVLMLLNKQDQEVAMNEIELCSLLGLEDVVNDQKCPTRVETTCAIKRTAKKMDPGIEMGFKWLIGYISKNFKSLKERVDQETKEQKEWQEKERQARFERVQKARAERERLEREQKLKDGCNKTEGSDSDNDDDDVVIGNPFKPVKQIREEMEKKEQFKSENDLDGFRIIQVTPTHTPVTKPEISDESVEDSPSNEEVIDAQSETDSDQKLQSSVDVDSSDPLSGNSSVGYLPPIDKNSKNEKKKGKKKNLGKRFKNKISPGSEAHLQLAAPAQLPPIRSTKPAEAVWLSNDIPALPNSTHSPSPGREGGNINWALAEDLIAESCEDKEKDGVLSSYKENGLIDDIT